MPGDDGPPVLVWERPEPARRPAPSPLSRESIVRTAIALADADGLAAVSLRKVGAALDAGPMRLYGYVSTKQELLDLMVDAVYGEIAAPEPDGDWRPALRVLAEQLRAAALRHEWFVELLGGRPHLGPNAMAYLEAGLGALDAAAALDGIDVVMRAWAAVQAYTIGAVRAEVAERVVQRVTGLDEESWQATTAPYMARMLATGRYPTLEKVVRDSTPEDPDAGFATGLDYVLDGIAARLAGRVSGHLRRGPTGER
jgi:AcrR family transcriptional regulator